MLSFNYKGFRGIVTESDVFQVSVNLTSLCILSLLHKVFLPVAPVEEVVRVDAVLVVALVVAFVLVALWEVGAVAPEVLALFYKIKYIYVLMQ